MSNPTFRLDDRVSVIDSERTRSAGTAGWHGRVAGMSRKPDVPTGQPQWQLDGVTAAGEVHHDHGACEVIGDERAAAADPAGRDGGERGRRHAPSTIPAMSAAM